MEVEVGKSIRFIGNDKEGVQEGVLLLVFKHRTQTLHLIGVPAYPDWYYHIVGEWGIVFAQPEEKKMERKTIVTFLLDRTGSMQSIKADTIGGFNEYLRELRTKGESIEFTLLQFDSQGFDTVCAGSNPNNVKDLTEETYVPRASTPLLDATMRAIDLTDKLVVGRTDNPLVVITIQTDGQENASHKHNLAEVRRTIEERQGKGWQFMFLGAGIDAYAEASKYGILAGNTMSNGRENMREAMRGAASATMRYAATGDAGVMEFTPKEKFDAGDRK